MGPGTLLCLTYLQPGGDTSPSWTWVPAVPSSVTLVPAYIELDQKVPARTRQVEEGLSHNSEVSASRSHVAVCGEPCVRAERQAGPHLTLEAGPRPPFTSVP